eukprot:429505-Rhodomonas_salina.2
MDPFFVPAAGVRFFPFQPFVTVLSFCAALDAAAVKILWRCSPCSHCARQKAHIICVGPGQHVADSKCEKRVLCCSKAKRVKATSDAALPSPWPLTPTLALLLLALACSLAGARGNWNHWR